MFDDFLGRLRKKVGRDTRYPAPVVDAGLKDELEDFYSRDGDRYRRLFLHGKPLLIEANEKPRFDLFERTGLVREKSALVYQPCVQVFPLHGALIATDLQSHGDADQVFSLMLEQLYIVARMGVRPGDRALELCVGSGVNCLFLADTAASVTGVEISPRAIEFARFNLAVNPGNVEVDLRQGSLFEPLGADEQFDYVLINPPFEPVPPGVEHFHLSLGGEDGLDVVRQLLTTAHAHLAPDGRLEIYTWSPGNESSVLVADLLRDAFPNARIEVHLVDSRPLDDCIGRFRSASGYAAWRQRLIDSSHTVIVDVFVRVDLDGPPESVALELPDVLGGCNGILGEWKG